MWREKISLIAEFLKNCTRNSVFWSDKNSINSMTFDLKSNDLVKTAVVNSREDELFDLNRFFLTWQFFKNLRLMDQCANFGNFNTITYFAALYFSRTAC